MRWKRTVCIMWLLSCCYGERGRSDAGDLTPGLRHGLLFQPRGQLTLATGTWTAVIRFRERDTEQQFDTIRRQFGHIENALQEMRFFRTNETQTAEVFRRKQFLKNLNEMWRHERSWMDAELQAAVTEIRELQAELKQNMRTRGLINALGDGFKWLFGTATEKDTAELHKQIKGVEVGLGKLHHIADLQTTLIGSLTKERKVNARNVAVLAKKAAELEITVNEARRADDLRVRNLRREVDLGQVVASAVRTAGAAVVAFHREVRQIARAMEHTQQGRVTPVILSPTRLSNTLKAISRHLPEGWMPAVPLSETPAHIYEFLDLAAVALADGWEVHVKIPLQYRPYSQYQLYQVRAIPTHLPNSSLALRTEVEAAYFAISRDQRLHLETSAADIDRCRRVGGRTLCHELTPLIKETRNGCLYHAFRDDREKTVKECKRAVTRPAPQVYAITTRKWLYVLPKEETFSMQCTGEPQPARSFRLQGTGVFSLPPGCAAMGDSYIVPAHLRRQADQPEGLQMDDLTHFKVSINKADLAAQVTSTERMSQPELRSIMDRVAEEDPSAPVLSELKGLMREWKEPEGAEDDLPVHFINHTSLSLGTVGVLGVIGLVVFDCYQRRRGAAPKDRYAQTPSLSSPITLQAPANPEPSSPDLSEIRARIAYLETTTRELQQKIDTLSLQGVLLEGLKKKYEELACLL